MSALRPFFDQLPAEDAAFIRERATQRQYEIDARVYEIGGEITHAVFPLTAVLSYTTELADGRLVETHTVGREGFAGVTALLGAMRSPFHVVAQVPGEALRLPIGELHALAARSRSFRSRSQGIAVFMMSAMSQSAACLAFHSVSARCARWLLATADRVDSARFELTQDYLASMLGVHRATVTVAAGQLQSAGLIRYRRGHVEILDRELLEQAACECYAAIRQSFDDFCCNDD